MENFTASGKPESNPSVMSKLHAEGQLLLGAHYSEGLTAGIQKMNDEGRKTAYEAAFGVALGVGLTLLDKNPAKWATNTIKYANIAFGSAFAYDVATRVGEPMVNVWNDPKTLDANKKKLGENMGDFATNVGLSIAGGFASSTIAEGLGRTRAASLIQGYSEKNVRVGDLEPGLRSVFEKKLPTGALPDESLIRLKTFADGTQIGVGSKSFVVTEPNGLAFNFDKKESLLGNSLKLNQITDMNVARSGSFNLGEFLQNGKLAQSFDHQASHMVANGRGAKVFDSSGGDLKIISDRAGSVQQVTSLNSVLTKAPGDKWTFVRTTDDSELVGAATKSYDFSKLLRDPFSTRSILDSTLFQSVVRSEIVPHVLDMGADKLSHIILLDHLTFNGPQPGAIEAAKRKP